MQRVIERVLLDVITMQEKAKEWIDELNEDYVQSSMNKHEEHEGMPRISFEYILERFQ